MATIVVSSAGVKKMWSITSWTAEQAQHYLRESHKVTLVGRLPDGYECECTEKIPIVLLEEFSPAVKDAIFASPVAFNQVDKVIVPITDIEGLSPIVGFMLDPDSLSTGPSGFVIPNKLGRINKNPFHKYYQIAQVANVLSMPPLYDEMMGKISSMLYHEKANKEWYIAISDMKHVFNSIADVNNDVQYRIMRAIAVADLDKKLKNSEIVKEVIRDMFPVIDNEIMAIEAEVRAEREKARCDAIRAARLAKRRGF